MQRRSDEGGLSAVLFTDIVGSTSIASEMGDARWSELVARHHRIVRGLLARFRGREIDTAGDGFFAASSVRRTRSGARRRRSMPSTSSGSSSGPASASASWRPRTGSRAAWS